LSIVEPAHIQVELEGGPAPRTVAPPAPDRCRPTDAEGDRYANELRLITVDPEARTPEMRPAAAA
jgi:hypothetical protein